MNYSNNGTKAGEPNNGLRKRILESRRGNEGVRERVRESEKESRRSYILSKKRSDVEIKHGLLKGENF